MATVRKRKWVSGGVEREAWVVNHLDVSGKRRLKTFTTYREAEGFLRLVNTIGHRTPEIAGPRGDGVMEFVAPVPNGKRHEGRVCVADAFRAAFPKAQPSTGGLIMHITAQLPPRIAISDVDNLIKPVMDALTGVAYCDDNQVCELLIRRIPSRDRQLQIKLWPVPTQTL